MKRLNLLALSLTLALGAISCSDYSVGQRPLLEINMHDDWLGIVYQPARSKSADAECDSDEVAQGDTFCCPSGTRLGPNDFCYEYREFEPVTEGLTTRNMQVTLANAGNVDLMINNVYLEEGGNPYVSLKWKTANQYGPEDFPLAIEPDLPTPKLHFLVVYEPDKNQPNNSDAVLVFETNHPFFEGKTYGGKYKVLISVANIGPEMKVSPGKITVGCVTGCSPNPITIRNEGSDDLTIEKIQFGSASSEFEFSNPPSTPLTIPKKGDPGNNPVTFSVMYCPSDSNWDDATKVEIFANDPNLSGGKKVIDIDVKQAPAILEFSTDSPFGYLDFSSQATHSANIYNTPASDCDHLCADSGHCCGCSIQIKGVDFDPPDTSDWYTVTTKDPTTDQALGLPMALKGGASIQFDVAYQKPAGHPEDRNSTMCIRYVAPLSGPQSWCASLIAKSQCEFSLAPSNQLLHFNSSAPSDIKEKAAVIVNNGSAPCTISNVSVTNQWDSASEDFELKEVIPGDTQVPAFSVLPVWVTYSPHTDDLQGKLKIEYEDELVGAVEEAVILQGAKEQDCALPIADPGGPYENVGAGETLTLDGCGSTDGECGGPIFQNGYLWFLLDKPEESAAQLNTEAGCIVQFQPDKPGDYEVGLIVFDQENFYQSDLSTTTFTVGQ